MVSGDTGGTVEEGEATLIDWVRECSYPVNGCVDTVSYAVPDDDGVTID